MTGGFVHNVAQAVKPVVASKLGLSCLVLIAAVGVGCGGHTPRTASGGAGGAGGDRAEGDGGNSSDAGSKDASLDTAPSDARGGAGGAAGGTAGSGGKAGTGGADGGAGVGGNGGTSGGRCSSFQFQPRHASEDQLLVDIDGDGRRDIVTAWNDADTHVLIFRQTAPRVFADPGAGSGYKAAPLLRPPVNENALDVALADFDGDGYGDIAVPFENASTSLGIYWGTGEGTFAARADLTICTGGIRAAVIDANEDGRPDLAVSCASSGSRVLINQGNRQFGSVLLSGTSNATALATGDLNHDGHVDVVVPDLVFKQLPVYLGDGHGAFAVPTGLLAATAAQSFTAAMGDLDGDGNADLVLGDLVAPT